MTLKPHSPLLTELSVKCSGHWKECNPEVLHRLESYLDGYARESRAATATALAEIPRAVMQYSSSILCIQAGSARRPVQLTGFLIDEAGHVVTTAHDMEGIVATTLVRNDGLRFSGTVIRQDRHRDLVLIKADMSSKQYISLTNGRFKLNPGEKIYTIGCPESYMGAIYAGVVSGPPRLARDMPLWQAALKVLPGSSGSPVFDSEGILVAVVKGRYRGTDSVGFLIPLTTVMEFLGR